MTKKLLTRSVGVLAISLLAACGQKGPLYLPSPTASATAAPASAPSPQPAASAPLKR